MRLVRCRGQSMKKRLSALASFLVFFPIMTSGQVGGYFLDSLPTSVTLPSKAAAPISGYGEPNEASSIPISVTLPPASTGVSNLALLTGSNTVWLPNVVVGFTATGVRAINDSGVVIGGGSDPSGSGHGVVWDATHNASLLAPIGPPSTNSYAYDISDNGTIVGGSNYVDDPQDYPTHATLWHPGSSVATDLGICPRYKSWPYFDGLNWDDASGISPNGVYIVGTCSGDMQPKGDWSGALWKQDGTVVELGGLTGASAVNNSGVIVGADNEFYASCPGIYEVGCPQAVEWDIGGSMKFLPVPTAYATSTANDVNSSNVIVGSIGTINPQDNSELDYAAMWSPTRQLTDLSKLFASSLPAGYVLTNAVSIKDSGRITVVATNPSNKAAPSLYYFLTPAINTAVHISARDATTSYKQQILLSASVVPASGSIASGQVSWYANGKLLASTLLNSSGVASYNPAFLEPGSYLITANYGGKSPDAASASPALHHTVVPSATRTSLVSSTSAPVHGKTFTLTATAVAAYGSIAGGVNFFQGTKSLGIVTLNAAGLAKKNVTVPTAGKQSFTASFLPNSHFASSHSNTLALTIK